MEQILTAELSDIFTASGRMYSDFIFVAGMYPEFENGKHMGSLKEQLWGIDCSRLDATKHWKFMKIQHDKWWQMDTNGVSAMSLDTWVNPTGYLGVQGTQASYF